MRVPSLVVLAIVFWVPPAFAVDFAVGSKKFTESVILGEAIAHLARNVGADVTHWSELGGTQVLFKALRSGEVDAYPEYTGTISQEILAGRGLVTEDELRAALAEMGIRMSRPLGFNNTYAIGMKRDVADGLGIETISDLRVHPGLRLGFTNEFMNRNDGWPSLRARYGLPHKQVRGVDHDLAYRGLDSGAIDAIDLYATDAEIRYYDLRVLADDRGHFPQYNAVILYRADLAERAPKVARALSRLEGAVGEAEMVAMNARAKLDRVSASRVAADFLADKLDIYAVVNEQSAWALLLRYTLEHLFLVAVSLSGAISLSVPLGIVAARTRKFGQAILAVVGAIQVIPSLALFVFMIPLLDLGAKPAIAALFLYSLLPIVRNTYAGLHNIPASVSESAVALGLSPFARLRLIELPLAARTILAGIKTSAVINVGTATLGALIGAGGYGQPILTGIRLDDLGLILLGAVPAAMLAFAMQGLFEVVERVVVPRGLRLRATHA